MRRITALPVGVAALTVVATIVQGADGCGRGCYYNGLRCVPQDEPRTSIGVTTARPRTGATTGRRSIGVTTGRPDHKFGLVQTEMSRDTPPPNPALKT
jgi:hypothetical protein